MCNVWFGFPKSKLTTSLLYYGMTVTLIDGEFEQRRSRVVINYSQSL